MYITHEEYEQMYDSIDEKLFNRLCYDACRVMDIHTTGIDNVKKLKRFPPTDEDDATAVKHCAARIVSFLHQIQQAEISAMETHGVEVTSQGMRGKVISSISAGNESISYSTVGSTTTSVDAAVKDKTVRDRMVAEIVWEYLRGIRDANGVSLLFMGSYPRGYLYAD